MQEQGDPSHEPHSLSKVSAGSAKSGRCYTHGEAFANSPAAQDFCSRRKIQTSAKADQLSNIFTYQNAKLR